MGGDAGAGGDVRARAATRERAGEAGVSDAGAVECAGAAGAGRGGVSAAGSREMAAIERWRVVLVPELDALIGELQELLAGAGGGGEISLALGAGGLPIVDVRWRGELPASVWSGLDARVSEGRWAGARVTMDGAAAPATFGDPRPVFEGADGRAVVVAAGGFAQPSEDAATVLARRTADLVRVSGDSLGAIVELYAGSGTLSILLAPLAKKLTTVESHEEAVRAAKENFEARGLVGKIVCGDAEAHDPGRADVVVLDPPRAGAREAAKRIAESAARAVVYVACDPVTMARDVATLVAAGFAITHVETIEIFPQTSHVETLVRLARGGAKSAG
ncbi:MAG: methyltransferase [Polyangiaceae bacterium]